MSTITLALSALLATLTAGPAAADHRSAPPPPTQPIYNGTDVAACGWPSVVSMQGSCTGTLVHPEVVVYAGHCGADYGSVQFGEDGQNAARSVDTTDCWAIDGVGEGQDFATCLLAEPVTDVPIVPILMGCEIDVLQPGVTTSLIGFGEANTGPYGIKRETTAQIDHFQGDEVFIFDENGQDTCYGDSGGPVMVALADGSWRVFGVTSYGISGECGTGTYYSMMHNGVAWIEQKTGVDVTPCHSAEGVWDPGPACGGFPEAPAAPVGSWPGACQADGPRGGLASTCGAPFDTEDSEPPQVAIVNPKQGAKYMTVKTLPLEIVATARDAADKPEGWGIAELRLIVNGKELADSARTIAPYTWDLGLPPGGYLLGVVAVDHAGNEALAEPVAIGVNTEPPALPEPATSGSDESGDSGESGDTGEPTPTTGAPDPTTGEPDPSGSSATGDSDTAGLADDDGCGCRQRAGADGLALLAPALLLGRRRRGLARTGEAR